MPRGFSPRHPSCCVAPIAGRPSALLGVEIGFEQFDEFVESLLGTLPSALSVTTVPCDAPSPMRDRMLPALRSGPPSTAMVTGTPFSCTACTKSFAGRACSPELLAMVA
nr:hypothetical protein GCM10025699_30480 [Microbacterium flavescens]